MLPIGGDATRTYICNLYRYMYKEYVALENDNMSYFLQVSWRRVVSANRNVTFSSKCRVEMSDRFCEMSSGRGFEMSARKCEMFWNVPKIFEVLFGQCFEMSSRIFEMSFFSRSRCRFSVWLELVWDQTRLCVFVRRPHIQFFGGKIFPFHRKFVPTKKRDKNFGTIR
jgi:hypothetical protein